MKSTNLQSAYDRLKHIGSNGYAVFADNGFDGIQVLSENFTPSWTDAHLAELSEQNDPVLSWIESSIGVTHLSAIEDSAAFGAEKAHRPGTLIALLNAGSRLGVVLLHEAESLSDQDVDEATAAALTLLSGMPKPETYPITPKELVYLRQVCAGASDEDIANDLQLSLRAVKERKRKAIDDLNALNIGHAVGIAQRAGLI